MRRFGAALLAVLMTATPEVAPPARAAAVEADAVRVLFLLVRQRDDLGALALAVSDPSSRSYGRYRPVDEIAARYGASQETIEEVQTFLEGYGVDSQVDVTGTFIDALLEPAQVEAIFGSDPDITPPVPGELSGAVTEIVGAFDSETASLRPIRLPPLGEEALAGNEIWPDWNMGSGTPAPCPAGDPQRCSSHFANPGPWEAFRSFTPDQLRTAYGIESTGLTGRGRSAVVLEFGEWVSPADIDAYTEGLGLPDLELHQVVIDGDAEALEIGVEATLDVETIAGLAPGLERLTLITGPAESDGEAAVLWLMMLSRALDARVTGGVLTDVISISYGAGCETELPPPEYVDASEVMFSTAAAMGVSIVVAAGDQGSSDCVPRLPPFDDTFLAVDYPASSPWVTSVGGTSLLLAPDNTILDVRAWNDWPLQLDRIVPLSECYTPPCRPVPVWAGAGGRSIVFERPPWQRGPGVELDSMRQVPDLAFLGDIYPGTLLHYGGNWAGRGNGTSQAAPIFASLVLLMNEANAASARPRIGFANPLLYHLGRKAPETFVDVVTGDNIVGDNEHRFDVDCCFAGPGYDRTTGWGSLLLDRAVAALPDRNVAVAPRSRLPIAGAR